MSAPVGRAGGAIGLVRDDIADLAPLVRRAVSLEAGGLARLRRSGDRMSVLVRLPFGVLAARTIVLGGSGADLDVTVASSDLLGWLDGERLDEPAARDAEWRGGTPPDRGWTRIDTVPDADVRPLVRAGAMTLKEASAREGVPGGQPRAEVADALLDSVVLTVAGASLTAPITLRTLSAVTRLGFLPRDSYVAVDVAGRWIRVAAAYGSVYAERPGAALTLG